MCTINLAMRKDEMPDKEINYYMDVVSWNTWLTNDDGEGYFGWDAKGLKKDRNKDKIIYTKLRPFHRLVTHQRYTTSGYGFNNIHPHESKNFMLQHNGIFSGLGDKEKSDTKYYLEKLEESFKETGDIVKTIKNVNKDTSGSYSIMLYDKNTGKLYYYKNGSTSMYFVENSEYFFMSTKESSLDYARAMFGFKNKSQEVKSHRIYEITNTGLRKVSGFDSKPVVVYGGYSSWEKDFGKNYSWVKKSGGESKKTGQDKTLSGYSSYEDIMSEEEVKKLNESPDSFYYDEDEKGWRTGK